MRLTEADASFIYMESASGPMHISSVYVLEGEVPFAAIRHRFESRLHLIPAYRRKLALVPFSLGHPKWVDDTSFDLSNHVILCELPADTRLQEAVDKAVALNEVMLDRQRPLWRMVVITGVPGKTLLLQQTHHAMIEGASGIALTTILYDLEPHAADPKPPTEPWTPVTPPSPATLISEAIQENLANLAKINPVQRFNDVAGQMQRLRKAADIMGRFVTKPAITAPFNAGIVGPRRRLLWLKKPFSDIREIRRHLGGTINDVVLAVLSESVARYLAQHKERVDSQYMRIMCPVNVD